MKKLFLLCLVLASSFNGFSQKQRSVEESARLIADQVVLDNKRGFIDNETGIVYSGVDKLEKPGMDVQLLSRYSHFYYYNGVINIAMIGLGEVLNEQKYIDYTINTIDFIFDNVEYFENRDNDVRKWSIPFGQFFAMEELDDCGAMGASIIDEAVIDHVIGLVNIHLYPGWFFSDQVFAGFVNP